MNSADEAYYLIKDYQNTQLHICSFWYEIPDSGIFPLCKLWILQNDQLFYSDSEILSSSCNTSLILANFYTKLKSSFNSKSSEFDFHFQTEDEENTANLELRLIINAAKDSYVSVFKVTLIRSFRGNNQQEFMNKVFEVCLIKDKKIESQSLEILKFSSLDEKIRKTQLDVQVMRDETGVKLAAKFMVLMNQIKEKSLSQRVVEEGQEVDINFLELQNKKKINKNKF